MSRGLIVVKAAYDPDAAVWYVESSDLEGVNAEAPSLEGLLEKLPGVVLDPLEEEGVDDVELPIALVARRWVLKGAWVAKGALTTHRYNPRPNTLATSTSRS